MPPTRKRKSANTRRSDSASSAPVLGTVPRSGPVRRRRRRALVPTTAPALNSGNAGQGTGRANPTARVTGRRSRLRNSVDVSTRGHVNRRNNRREALSRPLRPARESLEILRGYLLDCERNLLACQQQRGKLSDLVEQLVQEDKPDSDEERHYQQLNDALQQELQELLNESCQIAEQQLPNSECAELMASVRFMAEHRGETTEQTLNELMRRHTETSPSTIERDQEPGMTGMSQSFNETIGDFVMHGQDYDTVNQGNGILTVIYGRGEEDGEEKGDASVAESENGSAAKE